MMLGHTEEYIQMPSGILVTEQAAEDYAKKISKPKAIDFFAGCGGFSLGLMQAGFEVVAGVEIEPQAAMTYMTNLGAYPCQFHFTEDSDFKRMEKVIEKSINENAEGLIPGVPLSGSGWIKEHPEAAPGVSHFFMGDIRKMKGREILKTIGIEKGELDLVVGGPPCQGFSKGGKQNVMDPRNSLVFEYARMICEIQPKALAMENVPGILDMVTPAGVSVIDAFCRVLEDGGFGGLDSFLKSIEAQTGTVGLLRGKKHKKKAGTGINSKQKGLFE